MELKNNNGNFVKLHGAMDFKVSIGSLFHFKLWPSIADKSLIIDLDVWEKEIEFHQKVKGLSTYYGQIYSTDKNKLFHHIVTTNTLDDRRKIKY